MKKKCKKITFNSIQKIKTFKKDEPSNKLSDEHTEPMYHSPVSTSRVSSPVCKTKKKRSPIKAKQAKSDLQKTDSPELPKPESPIKKDEKKKSPSKNKKSPNKNHKKSPRKIK